MMPSPDITGSATDAATCTTTSMVTETIAGDSDDRSLALADMRDWINPFVPDFFVPSVVKYIIGEMRRLSKIASEWMSKFVTSEPRFWSHWEKECTDVWYLVKSVLKIPSALHTLCYSTLCKFARICLFHVLKAWVLKCKNIFKNRDEWKSMYSDLQTLAYIRPASAFESHWLAMREKWIPSEPRQGRTVVPGELTLDYIQSYWMDSNIILLWPMCYRNQISSLGQSTNNGCESHYFVVKYIVHGGRRPTDMRGGMQKVYGSPNDSEQEDALCYYRELDTRRKQKLSGARTNRIGASLMSRTQRVHSLLNEWVAEPSLVQCLDLPRLIFRVGGKLRTDKQREFYIISLHSNGCTCGNSDDITCKHVLAGRAFAKVAYGWLHESEDFESQTLFTGDDVIFPSFSTLSPGSDEEAGEPFPRIAGGSSRRSRRASPTKSDFHRSVDSLADTVRQATALMTKLRLVQNEESLNASGSQELIVKAQRDMEACVAGMRSLTDGRSYTLPTFAPAKVTRSLLGMSQDPSSHSDKGDSHVSDGGSGAFDIVHCGRFLIQKPKKDNARLPKPAQLPLPVGRTNRNSPDSNPIIPTIQKTPEKPHPPPLNS